MAKDVILTGLRANSDLHLGNYLGAILPMVELQKKHAGEYQVNMFVPDLHSFTTPIDHGKLYQNSLDNLKTFVAAGLDLNNADTYLYRQSYIPAHSEMTWILDCFAYFGELSRMTEFKDKAKDSVKAKLDKILKASKNIENQTKMDFQIMSNDIIKKYKNNTPVLNDIYKMTNSALTEMNANLQEHKNTLEEYRNFLIEAVSASRATAGLFNYPVLMAADILLYGARWVPVGDDQRQHIEFTRDIAMRMNNKFGELFTVPEPTNKQVEFSGLDNPVRIRSLRNPEKKMSKSVEDPAGTILLSDNPDDAAKKVLGATTDSLENIKFGWEKQPGVTNLLQILSLLTNKPQTEVNETWQGKNSYGELKTAVSEAVKAFLASFQDRYANVDESALIAKLEASEKAMNEVANQSLAKVQKAVGLRPQ